MLLEQPAVVSQQDVVYAVDSVACEKPVEKAEDAFRDKVLMVGRPRQVQAAGGDGVGRSAGRAGGNGDRSSSGYGR